MKSPEIDATELERLEVAIDRLWDEGCPAASDPAATARVALRRWRSVARRHRNASRETRINDVANGLIQAFEDHPEMVGGLKADYLCVAEAVAATLGDPPSN